MRTSFLRNEEVPQKFKVHFFSILKLFSEYGIKQVTIDNIASSLHISKKTIYKHYSCKAELVADIYLNDIYNFKISLYNMRRENTDVILKTICLHNLLFVKILSIKTHVHYDLKKYYPDLLHKVTELYREAIYDTCIEIINEGVKKCYFQKDIRPSAVATVFKSIIEVYTIKRLSRSNENNAFNWIDIFDYYFKSICNPVGLARWEILKIEFSCGK